MVRTRQTARKNVSRSAPRTRIHDSYPWNEPKAKCIIKSKPSEGLINFMSPKPIFYRDPNDPLKSYLIITPFQTPQCKLSDWVYKYDIELDEYQKFSKYPKDFHIQWPMHLLDENTNILYIFDTGCKVNKALSWKLYLETAKWEQSSIKSANHFYPRDVKSTWCQNGIKMCNVKNKIKAFDFELDQYDLVLTSANFDHCEKIQMMFVEKQNKIMSLGLLNQPICTFDLLVERQGPPIKKRKLNEGLESLSDNVSKMQLSIGNLRFMENTLSLNSEDQFVAFLKHDYIVFVLKRTRPVEIHNIDIWCLDLFNDSYKWYKSKKQLPGCVWHLSHHRSNFFNNFIHETDNEYVHFMHHSLDHVMIDTVDLVPDELKNIHRNVFQLTVYGYFREQIDIIKFDKNIPASLMYLTQCFLTHFV